MFLVVIDVCPRQKSFMSAGSLSLGGNMSIAVGPLGRNGEASGSLNTSGKIAAMYVPNFRTLSFFVRMNAF